MFTLAETCTGRKYPALLYLEEQNLGSFPRELLGYVCPSERQTDKPVTLCFG